MPAEKHIGWENLFIVNYAVWPIVLKWDTLHYRSRKANISIANSPALCSILLKFGTKCDHMTTDTL